MRLERLSLPASWSSSQAPRRHIKAEAIGNRLNALTYQLTPEDWAALNRVIDGIEAFHPKKRNKLPYN